LAGTTTILSEIFRLAASLRSSGTGNDPHSSGSGTPSTLHICNCSAGCPNIAQPESASAAAASKP